MSNARPHLAVDNWLQKLDLSIYAPSFEKYNGVEDMLHLSERDLKTMGVRNGGHRARLATSLAVLRKKYDKVWKCNQESSSHSTDTLTVDTNSKSLGSSSPVRLLHLENSSGVRSWPSSGSSSLTHSRHSSHRSSMEGSIGTDATATELKKALEMELSLDSSDLRSFSWYHGTILRQRAEELIMKDGDFIVRDCISQPGDFVITCKWKELPLHFIIKKVILQPHTVYEKVQYSFEDDSFDSIQDFITYYVGSKCPLSGNSGAVISHPINRSMPLSYYASRYGIQCQMHYAARALEKIPSSPAVPNNNQSMSPKPSQNDSPPSQRQMLKTPERSIEVDDEKNISQIKKSKESVLSTTMIKSTLSERKKLTRVGSDPALNINVEKKFFENRPNSGTISTEASKEMASQIESDKPPPKPSRVPSRKLAQRPFVVRRERKLTPPTPVDVLDDKNIFFPKARDVVPESPHDAFIRRTLPIPFKRKMSGETRFSFLDRPSVSDDGSLPDIEIIDAPFTVPPLQHNSCFNPFEFKSVLIQPENKPLESTVLNRVKKMLLEETPKLLACHLTRIDLEISKNFKEEDLGLGVTSGLELILLPQGQQLLKDLIERTECLKLFVAITILTCNVEVERVELLNKWIEIAVEIKKALGNFYGFTGIMLGLTIPEVIHLQSTWLALRHLHTEAAFAFETKLRPALKAMQETTGQISPNACIPYILSLLTIMNHHLSVVQMIVEEPIPDQLLNEDILNIGIPGEQNSYDFGLQLLEDHLEAGRDFLQEWPVFIKNGEITLQNVKYDDMLLDMFQTVFHLRLLWGCRGAAVAATERHTKFHKVLQVLHEKCEC